MVLTQAMSTLFALMLIKKLLNKRLKTQRTLLWSEEVSLARKPHLALHSSMEPTRTYILLWLVMSHFRHNLELKLVHSLETKQRLMVLKFTLTQVQNKSTLMLKVTPNLLHWKMVPLSRLISLLLELVSDLTLNSSMVPASILTKTVDFRSMYFCRPQLLMCMQLVILLATLTGLLVVK